MSGRVTFNFYIFETLVTVRPRAAKASEIS
jgi:hypothetical protein